MTDTDLLAHAHQDLAEAIFLEVFAKRFCDPHGLARTYLNALSDAMRSRELHLDPSPKHLVGEVHELPAVRTNKAKLLRSEMPDKRSLEEWRQDLLRFAADHNGVLVLSQYRSGPFRDFYGPEPHPKIRTRLFTAANNLLKNGCVEKTGKNAVYKMTAKGSKQLSDTPPSRGAIAQPEPVSAPGNHPLRSKNLAVTKKRRSKRMARPRKEAIPAHLDRLMKFAKRHGNVISVLNYRKSGGQAGGGMYRALNDKRFFKKLAEGSFQLVAQ